MSKPYERLLQQIEESKVEIISVPSAEDFKRALDNKKDVRSIPCVFKCNRCKKEVVKGLRAIEKAGFLCLSCIKNTQLEEEAKDNPFSEEGKPIKYVLPTLLAYLNKDKAKLISAPITLYRGSLINFSCECGKEGSKAFRYIIESGAICETCIYNKKGWVAYDKELLLSKMNEFKATVDENKLGNLCHNTNIVFTCSCGTETSKIFKTIVDTGAVCLSCINKNKSNARTDLSRDLLVSKIKESFASIDDIIIKNLKEINQLTRIPFTCTCGHKDELSYLSIIKTGATCIHCRNDHKGLITFNKRLLLSKLNNDQAILNMHEVQQENLSSTTIISFICSCGREASKSFKNLFYNGGAYCELCTQKNSVKKFEETCMERYGVNHPMYCEEFKQRMINTNIAKRGVECVFEDPKIKQKIEATCQEKYNVSNPLLNKDIYDKSRQTLNAKHGVDNPFKSPEIRKKAQQTLQERYNASNLMQVKEFKEKIYATCTKRYGTPFPMQNAEVAERASKNAYKPKEVITPSGKTLQMQGYEPFGYNLLLEEYKEPDILHLRTEVPELFWYDEDEKQHRYFADFYIPMDNLVIEVKSTFTYSRDDKQEKIKKTKEACLAAGYRYRLLMFDPKGKVLLDETSQPL